MDVLRSVPKKPEPAIIDRPSGPGGRLPLEDSGLVPKYSTKDTFGKVPEYLQRMKQVAVVFGLSLTDRRRLKQRWPSSST